MLPSALDISHAAKTSDLVATGDCVYASSRPVMLTKISAAVIMMYCGVCQRIDTPDLLEYKMLSSAAETRKLSGASRSPALILFRG